MPFPETPHSTQVDSVALGSQYSELDMTTDSNHGCLISHRDIKNKKHWSLNGLTENNVVILGASNIGRMKEKSLPNGWIAHCYPGAKLIHFISIVSAYSGPIPKAIFMCVGLNDRDQSSTTIKQNLNRLLNTSRTKFGMDVVHFVMLNFSKQLSAPQKANLSLINSLIESKSCKVVKPIPADNFATLERDHIHWNEETADCMLKYWVKYLNPFY